MDKAFLKVFPIRGNYSHCDVGGKVYEVFSPATEIEKEVAFQLIALELVGLCRTDETGEGIQQITPEELRAGIAKYKNDSGAPVYFQAPSVDLTPNLPSEVLKTIADQKSVIEQQMESIKALSVKVDALSAKTDSAVNATVTPEKK